LSLLALGVSGCNRNETSLDTSAANQATGGVRQSSVPRLQPRVLKGHSDFVTSVAASRDGRLLATVSSDKTVKIWDVRSGKAVRTMKGHGSVIWSVAISPDGKRVASGGLDRSLRIWDVASGKLLKTIVHRGSISSVEFSPSGKWIASGGRIDAGNKVVGGQFNIWESQTGRSVAALALPHQAKSVAFSPNNQLVLIGSLDKTIRVWNLKERRVVYIFKGYKGQGKENGQIHKVAFSPNGQIVAGGGWVDKASRVWLWNLRSGALLHSLKGGTGATNDLCFSPDGKTLATTTAQQVLVWNVASGKRLKSWNERNGIWSIAFLPNGRSLAIGSRGEDLTVRPDGSILSRFYGTVKLWPVMGSAVRRQTGIYAKSPGQKSTSGQVALASKTPTSKIPAPKIPAPKIPAFKSSPAKTPITKTPSPKAPIVQAPVSTVNSPR
jgi:WD40 repeat protein